MPLKQDSIYDGMETIARDFDARILAGANDYVLLHATGGDVDPMTIAGITGYMRHDRRTPVEHRFENETQRLTALLSLAT